MKLQYIAIIVLSALFTMGNFAYAETQNVSITPTHYTATAGETFSLDITYSTSDDCIATIGLFLNIYYRSDVVNFDSFSNIFWNSASWNPNPRDDTNDKDGDAVTDKYVTISWIDFMSNWPGPGNTGTFNIATLNFTASASNVGFSPINVRIGTGIMDCAGNEYTANETNGAATIPDTEAPTVTSVTANGSAVTNEGTVTYKLFTPLPITSTISDISTGGSKITAAKYTLDGTDPNETAGTDMTGDITVDSERDFSATIPGTIFSTVGKSVTVKIAGKDTANWSTPFIFTVNIAANQPPIVDSISANGTDVITTPLIDITANNPVTLDVTLSDVDGDDITEAKYTTDGTEPSDINGTVLTEGSENNFTVTIPGTAFQTAGARTIKVAGKDIINWGSSKTFTVNVVAGIPLSIELTTDKINLSSSAVDTATLTATIKDSFGNTVTSGEDSILNVTFAVDSTAYGNLGGSHAATVTAIAGVASTILSSVVGNGGTIVCSASTNAGALNSNSVNVVTQSQLHDYPPDPTGLTVSDETDGKVSLKWDYIPSPSGVTYNLYRSETENGIFYPINSEHIDISYLSYGKIVYADTVPDMEKTCFYKVRSVLNSVESQNFSNIVSASPVSPCHFECRLITDPSLMLNRGSTVRFYFQLLPAQSFTGTLNLSCEGLPYGISYTFYTDGTAQGASLSGLIPPASVILEITAGTLTPTGDLPFTLLMQNVWNSGSSPVKKIPLNLTVLPVNEEGIYAEVGETQIPFGSPVEIYGAILPPLSGRTVTLNLENLDTGSLLTRNLSTGTGGNFSDTQWISTLDMGTYEISAQWRDDNSDLQVSEFRYFTVEKGRPVLTCLRESSQLPSVDQDYTVTGKLNPALSYEPVKLLFFREGTRMSEYTVYTDGNGTYRITGSFFPQSGIWKVKAYWMGNDRYTGCESGFLELPVDTDSGRIIMLAGGQAEQGNSYWELTEKLTVRAYRDFKSCGYTNDMIWYMINSQMIDINYDKIPDPVVDDSVPSPDDFVHALETEYSPVLDSRTPLFVFLQGHGFRDEKFEVLNNLYLTASQIAGAINTLQTAAGCPVVFILESCYSGNFIPVLSGQNRVILTSAGNEIYNTDISGRISFSRYLFSKLREGDNLKKAFDTARKEMISLGYPSPQLDDNGDRKPDTSDGLLASRIYLGGTLSWGLRPEIGETALPSLLAQGISTAFLSAEVHMGQANLQRVWAQIIPPDSNITGGDSTVTWEESELTYNPATGKYEGNLSGLYLSGIYKIILMAEDAEFETAEPKIEYIGAEGSIQPGDVNNDGKVNLADVIVVLQLLCNKQTGEISKEAAIGNDKKIGLEEAVFVLRKTAGL